MLLSNVQGATLAADTATVTIQASAAPAPPRPAAPRSGGGGMGIEWLIAAALLLGYGGVGNASLRRVQQIHTGEMHVRALIAETSLDLSEILHRASASTAPDRDLPRPNGRVPPRAPKPAAADATKPFARTRLDRL